jgi:hypothetical protein
MNEDMTMIAKREERRKRSRDRGRERWEHLHERDSRI